MPTMNTPFDKRLTRIVRRHRRLANGVVHRVQKDGLIVAHPRLYHPRFPLQGLLMMMAAVVLFKAVLYGFLGGITYNERISQLNSGSVFEQAGGWVMQADQLTVLIATQSQKYLP